MMCMPGLKNETEMDFPSRSLRIFEGRTRHQPKLTSRLLSGGFRRGRSCEWNWRNTGLWLVFWSDQLYLHSRGLLEAKDDPLGGIDLDGTRTDSVAGASDFH